MNFFTNIRHNSRLKLALRIIVVFFAVFVVPLVINLMYTYPATLPIFAMSWEAKDVLSFYGSLLGSMATIFALYKTIDFTVKNQKAERILTVKPYLQTTKHQFTDISSLSPQDDIIFIELGKNPIPLQAGKLPAEIEALYISNTTRQSMGMPPYVQQSLAKKEASEIHRNNYLLYYQIENYGAGNAINVLFNINDKCAEFGFCVSPEKPKTFILVIKKELLEGVPPNEITLKFSLIYSDIISSTRYIQEEELYFSIPANEESSMDTLELVGQFIPPPIQMSEEKYASYKKRKTYSKHLGDRACSAEYPKK